VKRWINALNRAQRIVLSIGLAAALGAIGRSVELWGRGAVDGGWFGYAPNTHAIFTPNAAFLVRHPALDLLWWLFLVAVWAGASIWLFAQRESSSPPPSRG
jgi:hypothetical protein